MEHIKLIIAISFGLLGLLATSATAQYAGYLGRRLSVNFSPYYFPAMPMGSFRGTEKFGDAKLRYQVGIDYVVNPRTTIGLSYVYCKLGVENWATISYDSIQFNPTIQGKSVSNGVLFTYRLHTFRSRGVMAPVGPYFELNVGIVSSTYNFTSGWPENELPRFSESALWGSASVGNNFLLARRVILGMGFQILGLGKLIKASEDVEVSSTPPVTYHREKGALNRFTSGNLIMLYGRLGVLLF
jgi:hypothetical protein